MVAATLSAKGFSEQKEATNLLVYSRNKDYGYLFITEFEGVSKRSLEKGLV